MNRNFDVNVLKFNVYLDDEHRRKLCSWAVNHCTETLSKPLFLVRRPLDVQ